MLKDMLFLSLNELGRKSFAARDALMAHEVRQLAYRLP